MLIQRQYLSGFSSIQTSEKFPTRPLTFPICWTLIPPLAHTFFGSFLNTNLSCLHLMLTFDCVLTYLLLPFLIIINQLCLTLSESWHCITIEGCGNLLPQPCKSISHQQKLSERSTTYSTIKRDSTPQLPCGLKVDNCLDSVHNLQ